MPLLIDGWNLIRCEGCELSDPDIEPLESLRSLIDILERFQSTHNDPIILVMDSKNEYLGIDHRNNSKLKVVAAGDADSYIKRFIDNTPEKQRKNLRVVSSDNDIYYYARGSSAKPLRSDEFWEKLIRY